MKTKAEIMGWTCSIGVVMKDVASARRVYTIINSQGEVIMEHP